MRAASTIADLARVLRARISEVFYFGRLAPREYAVFWLYGFGD
jgi:hypothetical protein